MKLLFINPAKKTYAISIAPPLALATLAAYTPDWDIELCDENVSSVKFRDYDLVAISCMTTTSVRGYQIAQKFREKGIKVIMGGIHPSILPYEAINYCDSVVIGEAESIWGKVLDDFKNNQLKKFYYGERLQLDNMPIPRTDLYKKRYLLQSLQTARGCPFQCEFCSVSLFNGKEYRQRPIKDVINEVQSIKQRDIFFTDDNIIGINKQDEIRTIHLFNQLKQFNKKFSSQASLNLCDNDKVLEALSDGGLQGILIGIESLNKENLKQMHKGINIMRLNDYKKIIKKLHDNGIIVSGAFIFGSDFDTKKSFEDIVEFSRAADIDINIFSFLTPLPGTNLYKRLKEEKRLLFTNYPDDWSRYKGVVFTPKNMTPYELESYAFDALKQTKSFGLYFNRFFSSLSVTKSFKMSAGIFLYNLSGGWHRKDLNFISKPKHLYSS